MGTLLVRHRATSATRVEMSLDTAGTSAQCHLNKPPNWNSESSWGGPLVRAGPPGPAFRTKNQALASLREADVGVGRGPGDRPTIYAGDAVAPYLSGIGYECPQHGPTRSPPDRKSTRLNSSH